MVNRISSLDASKPELHNFLHHLHDTLVLLGAETRFAELVNNPETIDESDVSDLRCYNGKLVDETKHKLVNINKITVSVGGS